MSLIKSISGIRGTIGGTLGDNLTPLDIVKFTTAYATFIKRGCQRPLIVVGRDARISGTMVSHIVTGTLIGCGCDVQDIGLASTPTTEVAVIKAQAAGGIIITASHNPKHWNALKLLNANGEFLTAADGQQVLALAENTEIEYPAVDAIGNITAANYDQAHIDLVLALPTVNTEAIRAAKFHVAVDTINSVGAIILPKLLEQLGVSYTLLNGEPNGNFAHNPEPLEKNLSGIMQYVADTPECNLGIVVDPDVDRLAFISEDGTMYGEEYTLVSVADHVLTHTPGPTVSNLSSTRALRDITQQHGQKYTPAAVGEVNVTTMMHKLGAVIGGEGNGGVIYPEAHTGRDALVGIALFLTMLAERHLTPTQLRATLPAYYMAKNRVDLTPDTDVDAILARIQQQYEGKPHVAITTIDGVKLDFPDCWAHLRKSNTEPIIRIYTEAPTPEQAQQLADNIKQLI